MTGEDEVDFYLGFSWSAAVAYDVSYPTFKSGERIHNFNTFVSLCGSDVILGNEDRNSDDQKLTTYWKKKFKCEKLLTEISKLEDRQNIGDNLENNQEEKGKRKKDIEDELKVLEQHFWKCEHKFDTD
ncbi:uncharacterized protein LOC143254435 [Tachypleus tridentatus]|uniref:uncharacterized protein LOC143254435 n=1 Tax=Tachypleus tridentatus TaxID=6853 RepID=UPI003FD0DF3D